MLRQAQHDNATNMQFNAEITVSIRNVMLSGIEASPQNKK
jgi:hypothetical protein